MDDRQELLKQKAQIISLLNRRGYLLASSLKQLKPMSSKGK